MMLLNNNLRYKIVDTQYYSLKYYLHQSSTIGLVTLNEMKAKQENIVKEREKKLAQKQAEKEREKQRQLEAKQAEKNKQKRQVCTFSPILSIEILLVKRSQHILQIQALSFTLEDEESNEIDDRNQSPLSWKREIENDESTKLKKIKKDPTADTSFLPDREREEEENRVR